MHDPIYGSRSMVGNIVTGMMDGVVWNKNFLMQNRFSVGLKAHFSQDREVLNPLAIYMLNRHPQHIMGKALHRNFLILAG